MVTLSYNKKEWLNGQTPFDCKGKNTKQQTITCSNSTIETLEKGVKYVQS